MLISCNYKLTQKIIWTHFYQRKLFKIIQNKDIFIYQLKIFIICRAEIVYRNQLILKNQQHPFFFGSLFPLLWVCAFKLILFWGGAGFFGCGWAVFVGVYCLFLFPYPAITKANSLKNYLTLCPVFADTYINLAPISFIFYYISAFWTSL